MGAKLDAVARLWDALPKEHISCIVEVSSEDLRIALRRLLPPHPAEHDLWRDEGREEERRRIVEWLRKPLPGTLCEDQDRDNRIADAIDAGRHLSDGKG